MRGFIVTVIAILAALTAVGSTASAGRAAPRFDTLPDPQTLLDQSDQALVAANTLHSCVTAKFGSSVAEITLRLESDEDIGAHAVRVQQRIQVDNAKADTESDVQIKSKAWYKSKNTANRWRKGRGNLSSAGSAYSVDPLGVQQAAQGKGVVRVTYATVGAETLNGVAVWRVRQTLTKRSSKGNPYDTTVDYLIGQTDSLPYQVSGTAKNTDDGTSSAQTNRYSHWGQHLAIKAPKVGSKTPLHGVTIAGSCPAV